MPRITINSTQPRTLALLAASVLAGPAEDEAQRFCS